MNLTSKTSLQAKTCLLVVASIALATMAASKAAADQLRVFNERVSGVPAANPVAIADNVYSPEFAPALVARRHRSARESLGLDYGIRAT